MIDNEIELLWEMQDWHSPPGIWHRRAKAFWDSAEVVHGAKKKVENTYKRVFVDVIDEPKKRSRSARKKSPWAYKSFELVTQLLQGYSIELMLKAIWFARNPSERRPRPEWKGGGGHNLLGLSADLNLKWTADERKQLGDLREAIVWLGRYPSRFDPGEGMWKFDLKIIERIYHALSKEFEVSFERNKDQFRGT